jgi:4-diphosphocytidyl-2-C-methyl-D-erythritol kinase
MADRVRIEAPAKVNLLLRVLAREASGYHSLETVFCAISLCDEVEVRRGDPGVALRLESATDLGPVEDNLAVRAAQRYHAALGQPAAVEVLLRKRIPAAAGLGGGSSDAAAVLRALDALHGAPLGDDVLLRIGGELGSDVPFFLCGSTHALGWARGDRLLALPPLPERAVVVAHPGTPMPTGSAFRRFAESRGPHQVPPAQSRPLEALRSWTGAAAGATNDFEPVADELIASLPRARAVMRDAGATIAMLAGSGASLFGVFAPDTDPASCSGALRDLGYDVWTARTLQSPPVPLVDPPPASG